MSNTGPESGEFDKVTVEHTKEPASVTQNEDKSEENQNSTVSDKTAPTIAAEEEEDSEGKSEDVVHSGKGAQLQQSGNGHHAQKEAHQAVNVPEASIQTQKDENSKDDDDKPKSAIDDDDKPKSAIDDDEASHAPTQNRSEDSVQPTDEPSAQQEAADEIDERTAIQDEAVAHLARRASSMNIDPVPQPPIAVHKDAKLPAAPPPPPIPEKDAPEVPEKNDADEDAPVVPEKNDPEEDTPAVPAKNDVTKDSSEVSVKSESEEIEVAQESEEIGNPPEVPAKGDTMSIPSLAVDTTPHDVPEAPQGVSEMAGEEIQHIMDQFQAEETAMKEEEIMSPRLERQQPILQLPPRTSSLDPRDKHPVTPGSEQRGEHYFSGRAASSRNSVVSVQTQPATAADETSSITSHRTSIFQPPPPSPDPEPALPFDFHRFLEQLRHRTADPVARFLRSFLIEFGKKQWMVHEQVKIIGDFLEFISKKMGQCEVWRTVSDAEFDNAREGMEKLVMNRLYTQTFSPAIPAASGSPRKSKNPRTAVAEAASQTATGGRKGQHQEDVERDDVIAQKMRIYGWIKEEHLDIKPIGDKGKKFLTMAEQELLKLNTYRAPRDKVICVLNCCKVIFGFLKNSKGDQGADSFVPLLIYTVLRARPEHLVSNVQYIWRFRNQEKLGGEAGYYMSSLMGVVTFLENLDRTMITISDEEFERNVEQAVSAIAEGHKADEYEQKAHTAAAGTSSAVPSMSHLSEKSAISRPEVTPRNSAEVQQTSPRRQPNSKVVARPPTGDDDDTDAVTGLLRTIQKPLSSIGRIFSDEPSNHPSSAPDNLRPASTPLPPRTSSRALSPAARIDQTTTEQGRRRSAEQERQRLQAQDAAIRQESVETAEIQRERQRGFAVVVETLQGMFPNLDKDIIEDVVRAQEGNVGRAVDACLALSGQN